MVASLNLLKIKSSLGGYKVKNSAKHLNFMERLETNKHQAEEDIDKQLDEEKDSEFIMCIATRRGGYNAQIGY